VLLTVVQAWGALQRLLQLRWLRVLGDLSVGIYLLHVPVQMAVLLALVSIKVAAPTGSLAFWLGITVLEVTCAWAVHVSFEQPCRIWLRAVAARRRAAAAVT
jgi:peptidoglycan/LPS O-acetylase OafA/YrhL